MTAARRDVEGGLEVRRVPHTTGAWLLSRARDTRPAADTWDAARRPGPGGLLDADLPTRRSARALRDVLLAAVPDWNAPPHPDDPDARTADAAVRMANTVNNRRLRGECLGCGLAPGLCHLWEAVHGPRYTAEDVAWIRRPRRG